MKKLIGTLCCVFFLGGCASYWESVERTNQSIAESNSEIAQACADAIESAQGDPAAIVALSLTICQRQSGSIVPEGPSQIITASGNALLKATIPVAAVEITRSSGSSTDVKGDYTHSHGSGTADASKSESHTELMMPEE